MFMDPSAFEAEDIERELADAGMEPPETKSPTGFPSGDGGDSPVNNRGGSTGARNGPTNGPDAPPSGSSYGFSASAVNSGMVPRAMAKDRDRQLPAYGRHSKGGSGSRSNGRPQMAPPSSTPPPSGSPPLQSSRGSGRPGSPYGGAGIQQNGGGDEIKLAEDSPDSNIGSPMSGASSRARVLAQQREIQRKRRQQALNSGGIRASDAASLSRGLVSGGPGVSSRSPSGVTDAGVGGGVPGVAGGDVHGEREAPLLEEEGYSFSPSVKQFSAPRQVEGDGYTAFNSKPGGNFGERSAGVSEFDRRRASGHGGVLGDTDEEDDELFGGGGGGGAGGGRRRHNKLAPDMGTRAGDEEDGSPDALSVKGPSTAENYSARKARHAPGGDNRRTDNRPDDWDDRHRPSTKTYKWKHGSDDDGSAGDNDANNNNNNSNNNNTGANNPWRSVGRETPSVTTTVKQTGEATAAAGAAVEHIGDDSSGEQQRSRSASSSSHDSNSNSNGSRKKNSRSKPHRSNNSNRSRSPSHYSASASKKSSKRLDRRRHSDSSESDQAGSDSAGSGRRAGGGRGGARSNGRQKNRRRRKGQSSGSESGSDGGGARARERRRAQRSRRHHSNSYSDDNNDHHSNDHGSDGRRSSNDNSYSDDDNNSSRNNIRRSSSSSNSNKNKPHKRRGKGSNNDNKDEHDRDHDNGRDSWSNKNGREKYDRYKDDVGVRDGDRRGFRDAGRGGDGDVGGGGKHRHASGRNVSADRSAEKSQNGSHDSRRGRSREEEDSKDQDDTKQDDAQADDDNNRDEKSVRGGGSRDRGHRDGITADPGASGSPEGEMAFNMDALDLSDMKKFLLSPCPRAAGVVQCYIRRNKTRANKIFPEYTLFLKEGDRFLMCSKKRPNNATSNYLISMRAGDLDRNSKNFLGKLRANFVGTEFQVFDDGYNPKEQTGAFGISKNLTGSSMSGGGSGGPMREELGCVMYASNVLGSRGPRKMQVAIPVVSEDGVVSKWSELDGGRGIQAGGGGSKAIERVKNRDYDGSLYMVNKPPRWNDQVGAYVLNFYGRVTMASVKNFQLVSTEDFDRIILQFGRVAKDEFTMDFQYPISPFQAFAITLSSFDSKIACD